VQVYNLQNAASVSAGHMHTVAVKSDGTVWSWGGNDNAQLGDGTTMDRHLPVQVRGPGGAGFFNLHTDAQVQGFEHITPAFSLAIDALAHIHSQNMIGGEVRNIIVDVDEPRTGLEVSDYASGIGNFIIQSIEWVNAGDTFSAGTRYSLNLTLIANENYIFSEVPVAVINGYLATVISNTGTTMMLTLEFSETE
jgi:hypothetical protein